MKVTVEGTVQHGHDFPARFIKNMMSFELFRKIASEKKV
jgi:hypothetical protein